MQKLLLIFLVFLSNSATANILGGAGLKGFGVAVEPLDPEARQTKLNEASIRKIVIARMQKQNVKLRNDSDAQLYVRIVVLTSRDTQNKILGFGVHVELSFREMVFVKRQPKTFFMAPTWFKGAVTVANANRVVPDVVASIANLTDQFLRDYKAANPVFNK